MPEGITRRSRTLRTLLLLKRPAQKNKASRQCCFVLQRQRQHEAGRPIMSLIETVRVIDGGSIGIDRCRVQALAQQGIHRPERVRSGLGPVGKSPLAMKTARTAQLQRALARLGTIEVVFKVGYLDTSLQRGPQCTAIGQCLGRRCKRREQRDPKCTSQGYPHLAAIPALARPDVIHNVPGQKSGNKHDRNDTLPRPQDHHNG